MCFLNDKTSSNSNEKQIIEIYNLNSEINVSNNIYTGKEIDQSLLLICFYPLNNITSNIRKSVLLTTTLYVISPITSTWNDDFRFDNSGIYHTHNRMNKHAQINTIQSLFA